MCPTTNRRLQGLLPVGTKVDDKYRIDAIIGVGGMGVVYRADQIAIRRPVALKMLLPEYIVYPDLVARVQREARTAGQIESPNVVSIVDLGNTTEYGPYIAMELLRGQELATVVEQAGGRMDPAEAVDIMRQVLLGLEAAHKRGVIHRDLKPENIFLTEDEDGKRRVKVLDFGISKLRDDTELNSLTRTGTVMGTPQFMAPEQAAGARDQDVRLDLYAAGAVLYAVLCNGLPYEAENYNLLINEILNKQPIQILQRNPGLDPRLASIVMKSIAKKPDARYQSAREMADALGAWYDQRHTPFTPPAPPVGRIHAARAATFLGADTPAIDLRRNPTALGPAREPGRRGSAAPALLTTPDESLARRPELPRPRRATVASPCPTAATPDHDFYDENPPSPPPPRTPARPPLGRAPRRHDRPDEDRGSPSPRSSSVALRRPAPGAAVRAQAPALRRRPGAPAHRRAASAPRPVHRRGRGAEPPPRLDHRRRRRARHPRPRRRRDGRAVPADLPPDGVEQRRPPAAARHAARERRRPARSADRRRRADRRRAHAARGAARRARRHARRRRGPDARGRRRRRRARDARGRRRRRRGPDARGRRRRRRARAPLAPQRPERAPVATPPRAHAARVPDPRRCGARAARSRVTRALGVVCARPSPEPVALALHVKEHACARRLCSQR
ncbi:MAG: serine/threonine-protein kinase [Polyangiales bacterium]